MTTDSALLAAVARSGNVVSERPDQRVRAVAWVRVSTEMQDERGLSKPEQLRAIMEYAERNGIDIVRPFDGTGSAFKRKQKNNPFYEMLEYANENRCSVIVHDLSRFSRNTVEARTLVQALRAKGLRLISVTDPDVDPESLGGFYMEQMLFMNNEAYSRQIAFHTLKGCRANLHERDAETGWCYKNGGQAIFGYRCPRSPSTPPPCSRGLAVGRDGGVSLRVD